MGEPLLQILMGEPLSSVFSTDGTLISASAAPHCGGKTLGKKMLINVYKFLLSLEQPGLNFHTEKSKSVQHT